MQGRGSRKNTNRYLALALVLVQFVINKLKVAGRKFVEIILTWAIVFMLKYTHMIRTSTQLLFAFLLMLSQAALVSHDAQHLGSAHNELCAVYLSQDHSAHNVAVSIPQIFHASPERFKGDAIDLFIPVSIPVYASRAPPKTVFFS